MGANPVSLVPRSLRALHPSELQAPAAGALHLGIPPATALDSRLGPRTALEVRGKERPVRASVRKCHERAMVVVVGSAERVAVQVRGLEGW